MLIEVIRVHRIGQTSGTTADSWPQLVDAVGWPLRTDSGRWNAIGIDEGASAEHSDGRLYFVLADAATDRSIRVRFAHSRGEYGEVGIFPPGNYTSYKRWGDPQRDPSLFEQAWAVAGAKNGLVFFYRTDTGVAVAGGFSRSGSSKN